MIKLIATDLDGTLLDSRKKLPPRFERTFRILRATGVIFVAASGRQYPNICDVLAPCSSECYIIGDNGSVCGYGKDILETHVLNPDRLEELLSALCRDTNVYPVICTAQNAYFAHDDALFVREVGKYYTFSTNLGGGSVRALRDRVLADPNIRCNVTKVALYARGKADELFPSMPRIDGLESVVSGADWIDFARDDVNKGVALRAIMDKFGLSPDDCLAFGDQFNDKPMLEQCKFAYVTSNASEGMKAIFHPIGSNDDGAVLRCIEELLDI